MKYIFIFVLLISCNNKNALLFDGSILGVDLDPISGAPNSLNNTLLGTCEPNNGSVSVNCGANTVNTVCINGSFSSSGIDFGPASPVTCSASISDSSGTVASDVEEAYTVYAFWDTSHNCGTYSLGGASSLPNAALNLTDICNFTQSQEPSLGGGIGGSLLGGGGSKGGGLTGGSSGGSSGSTVNVNGDRVDKFYLKKSNGDSVTIGKGELVINTCAGNLNLTYNIGDTISSPTSFVGTGVFLGNELAHLNTLTKVNTITPAPVFADGQQIEFFKEDLVNIVGNGLRSLDFNNPSFVGNELFNNACDWKISVKVLEDENLVSSQNLDNFTTLPKSCTDTRSNLVVNTQVVSTTELRYTYLDGATISIINLAPADKKPLKISDGGWQLIHTIVGNSYPAPAGDEIIPKSYSNGNYNVNHTPDRCAIKRVQSSQPIWGLEFTIADMDRTTSFSEELVSFQPDHIDFTFTQGDTSTTLQTKPSGAFDTLLIHPATGTSAPGAKLEFHNAPALFEYEYCSNNQSGVSGGSNSTITRLRRECF